jgi:hypothetical protein
LNTCTLVSTETATNKPSTVSLETIRERSASNLNIYKKIELEGHFPLSVWDLEEISKDNVTEHCWHHIDKDGGHLIGFWAYFDWWKQVASELAHALHGDEQSAYETELRGVVARVLDRWPDALLSEPHFSTYSGTIQPKLDLLKQYFAFTRFICATAAKMYPGYDLAWLTDHA